jgi:predicted glycogen debranching enzyme
LPAGGERGAETLRAVPALITLRAFEPAREILRGFVDHLNEGLVPESFDPVEGRPRFGEAAPSLWLVHAAELLTRRSEDLELVRDTLYPAVEGIMQAYRSGTRHGIQVRPDGLLSAGEGEAASRPADLNALWFHALVAASQLARLAGRKENGAFYLAWAREHQKRVLESLWDEDRGCLYEAATDTGFRPGLSPGQLLAVSLSPSLLPPPLAERLVARIERELFTPLGLRDSPAASTASPAWLGAFITAYLRVHQRSAAAQTQVRAWLETLRGELEATSAGHLPEVFPAPRRGDAAARRADAAITPPPQPVSVLAAAELLRAWVEEVDRAEEPAGVA